MAKVEVRNLKNKPVGELELNDAVFDYSASETLVWEAVRAFLARQRKGTHKAKNRVEVRGGGGKLWRQKGTGRARVGSVRSPLWRKGGAVFGPRPRDYSQRFPRKKKRGAVRMVLSDKLRNQRLIVVEDLKVESHKTRDLAGILEVFDLSGKVLIVDELKNRNLYLSSRNLPGVKMVPASGVNVYDLLNCEHLMLSKEAVEKLEETLKP